MRGGIFPAMFSALEMSNPIVTALGNQFYNKDSFTQRELVNDAMSTIENTGARLENFFQTIVPQLRAYQAFQEAKDQLPYRGYEGAVVPDWHEFVGDKIFGFKKSYFMRMIKFGKLTDEQVIEFTDKCKELIAEGEKPSISVPSCLDYIKQQNQSDGGEATPRQTESVVLQLKFMGKKLKVTGDGDAPTIKTDFDSDDMEEFNRLMEIVQSYIGDR